MTSEPEHDNGLLRHLDAETMGRLRPRLEPVVMQSQAVLYHAGDRISHIYFPDTAVLCMLTIMVDGRTVESATVGNEGASWISASYGTPTMPCQTMVAIGGRGHRIASRHVEEESQRSRIFHDLLTVYSHALLISSLRTGACNALHSVSQRAARWMLTTLDRTPAEQFAITHEFMAALLGCNRTGLTTVLGELEERGAIHTRRGRVELADRKALEKCSCECYAIIRSNFAELFVRERRVSGH